jgi:hypothetical protein
MAINFLNAGQFPDNTQLSFGTSSDLNIEHDGSNSKIENYTGHLNIIQEAADKDISFYCDNGSGGTEIYFYIDGSGNRNVSNKNLRLIDTRELSLGSSDDLKIYHNATDSIILNETGNLYISNDATDKDIIFQSDDGSGGLATYFYVDGSTVTTVASKQFKFEDDIKLFFGTGADSALYASSDDLIIEQTTDDKDIIFKCDDGSGGTASYMVINGSAENISINKNTVHPDSIATYWGDSNDLQLYHDSNNSYIVDNGTGNMIIAGNQVYITNAAGSEYKAQFTTDGAVNLYYDNSKKFETTSAGVSITGSTTISTIDEVGSDTDKFLMSDSGVVKYVTGANLRSYIGAGTGSGTVTSVGITAGTGISVSGSPITGSGSITVTNTAPATIDGSGAATRLAYWSDADTLTSDAGLTYDAGNHLTTTAQVRAGDGAKGTPTYSFDSDRNTGIYLEAADDMAFSAGGTTYLKVNGSGVGVASDIYHVGDSDTKIAFTTNEITVTTGGTDAFDVTNGATRFFTSTRFTANATWDDNSKALFGDDSDIQIYSDNTTAYIEMPTLTNFIIGDSTAFNTGNIALVRVAELTGTKSMEEDWMGMYTSANSGLSYMTSSGTVRIETQNSGAKVTGALTVTGDVLDRDIPCLFNSNFSDGTASNIYIVPFNSLSEATVSAKTYYHYVTMPYAGKLTKIIMKNVSGSPSSGFTTQLFLYVNGSQQASSSELTISSSKIEWTPTTSNTFAAGDELSFGYQKSASSKTWSGVSFGVAIELTDYDI